MTDQRPTYLPFDQDKHLSPPPWSPDDPALQAWEAAHAHDVRSKCYVEYGCQAIENALEAAEAERDALRDAIRNAPHAKGCLVHTCSLGDRCGAEHGTCTCWKAAALAGTQEDAT